MGVPITELLRGGMSGFTASERKVARALLGLYPIAGLEPLVKLSVRAGVSMPTVIRFVTKLGFDGYPDFQAKLRDEVHARISSPSSRYDSKLSSLAPGGLLRSGFSQLLKNLESTAGSLSVFDFEAAVELISDPKFRIRAIGGRVSHVLAIHLVSQLSEIRPDVELLRAGTTRLMAGLLEIGPRDVIVVFDYKRYQLDTVTFAKQAARRGATVILVTDPLLSPIAEVAKHVMTFPVVLLPPFDSPIGGFAIVEMLIAGVAARLGDRGRTRIEAIENLNRRWMFDEGLVDDASLDGRSNGRATLKRRQKSTSRGRGTAAKAGRSRARA